MKVEVGDADLSRGWSARAKVAEVVVVALGEDDLVVLLSEKAEQVKVKQDQSRCMGEARFVS